MIYNCVVKALGATVSTTYFQGCWAMETMNTAMKAATTGTPSNGNTCYSGTTGAGSRLYLPSSSFWIVFVSLFSVILLRSSV